MNDLIQLPDAPSQVVNVGESHPVADAAKAVSAACNDELAKHAELTSLLAEQDAIVKEAAAIKDNIVEANAELAQASDAVVRSLAALDQARKTAGLPYPDAEGDDSDNDSDSAREGTAHAVSGLEQVNGE